MKAEICLKKSYRIKEFNSIYDKYFGKGKGWIMTTNFLSFSQAIRQKNKLLMESNLYYEIIDCSNDR